jgi:hypothetical protein
LALGWGVTLKSGGTYHRDRTIDKQDTTLNKRHDEGTYGNGGFSLTSYTHHYATSAHFTAHEVGNDPTNVWDFTNVQDTSHDLQKSGAGRLGVGLGTFVSTDYQSKSSSGTVNGNPWSDGPHVASGTATGTFVLDFFTLQDTNMGNFQPRTAQTVAPPLATFDPDMQAEIAAHNKLQDVRNPLDGLIIGMTWTKNIGMGVLVIGSWVVGIGEVGWCVRWRRRGCSGLRAPGSKRSTKWRRWRMASGRGGVLAAVTFSRPGWKGL